MTVPPVQRTAEPAQDRTRRSNRIISNIRKALQSYGYMELALPMYEYYDLLKETSYGFTDENIIRFVDRNTGKTLVLRPDFTPQVCRAVVGYMGDYPLPLRLYYTGSVFRTVESDRGHKTEKYQIGWELFGGQELCGDIEMFLLTNSCLKSLGLTGYRFVIGDSMFLQRVIDLAGSWEPLKTAIAGKRRHDIDDILSSVQVGKELKPLIEHLPMAFGGAEILGKLRTLCSFDDILSERVDYMINILSELSKFGISKDMIIFDAAQTQGLDYYTGINFEIVHDDSGYSLGRGGRYDNLMRKFGSDIKACGMALHVDELMSSDICRDSGQEFDYLVSGYENMAKAESLRAEGYSVFFLLDDDKKDEFLKIYKFKNFINGGR